MPDYRAMSKKDLLQARDAIACELRRRTREDIDRFFIQDEISGRRNATLFRWRHDAVRSAVRHSDMTKVSVWRKNAAGQEIVEGYARNGEFREATNG